MTADINEMPAEVQKYRDQLEGRVMLVKRCQILPVEAIVRGYITGTCFLQMSYSMLGSGMKEYKEKGTICDIPLPKGLVESAPLSAPLFTPSTKAEIGDHGAFLMQSHHSDENIHPSKLLGIIGEHRAQEMEKWAVELYTQAREYAAERGVLIADTKFEFGVDANGSMVLVDEVLTPGQFLDSSGC